MKKSKTISAKEWLFCRYYSRTRNAREAASRAGYRLYPEKTGERLLKKPSVIKEIRDMREEVSKDELVSGLKRMAFGSVSDALRLLYEETIDKEELEKLDLFNISEIKKAKGGGLEIKFFDRLRALERLAVICEEQDEFAARSFFESISKGEA